MTPFILVKKNTQCGLEPENFTFARQPIYEPPAEIVRPAQTRGSNQPAEPDSSLTVSTPTATPVAITFATPTEVTNRRERDRSNVTSAGSTTPVDDGSTLVEGRAKRKRVAPTRFEDEDFAEASPVKKKPLTVKVTEKTPSTLVTSSSAQVTPPIKISMKSTTSGGIRTPIIVTTPVVTQPVVKPPPQQAQVTTPKEKTEAPATTTTVTITTSGTPIVKTESAQEETAPTITVTTSNTTDQSKSGTANGTEAESNKDEVVITTAPPVITVSQPQPVVKKPIAQQPKSSILETNLTRQFKP